MSLPFFLYTNGGKLIMKKEDLIEITLAIASLDKRYQSLTSYALASEKKRKKIDKAVAKLIHLIHQSDEYCVDQESAMYIISQLNKSKIDHFYRPNIYFMSNISGGISESPKEFNETQTEEIVSKETNVDHIDNDEQLKLDAKGYNFDFDDAVKAILKEANSEKLSSVKYTGVCSTEDYAARSFDNREVGDAVYVIKSNEFRLKYDPITERSIPAKSASTNHTDNDPKPKLNPKIASKLIIERKVEDEGDELFDLAKTYRLNIEDMINWIKKTADLQEIGTAFYKGKILTLESLKDKPRGEVYYCPTSRKLYLKYDTGRDCYIASPKF